MLENLLAQSVGLIPSSIVKLFQENNCMKNETDWNCYYNFNFLVRLLGFIINLKLPCNLHSICYRSLNHLLLRFLSRVFIQLNHTIFLEYLPLLSRYQFIKMQFTTIIKYLTAMVFVATPTLAAEAVSDKPPAPESAVCQGIRIACQKCLASASLRPGGCGAYHAGCVACGGIAAGCSC